jgi:hypothetical protein
LVALVVTASALAGPARAAPSVELRATLVPEQLGRGTTVGFGLRVVTRDGNVPPPLTGVELSYPGNLGVALSGLGLATCDVTTLEAFGPPACPADSIMGFGTAVAEIPIGPLIAHEAAEVTIVRAPTVEARLALLFYVEGGTPVSAQLVFPGLLAPAVAPFGGAIQIEVPLVPSLPGAPDVAVVRLTATLGPEHITYYEHVRGKTRAYNPRGILLPRRCPSSGFRFSGRFRFADGSTTTASTTVPCPRRRRTASGPPTYLQTSRS